jgi:hypothetical protein
MCASSVTIRTADTADSITGRSRTLDQSSIIPELDRLVHSGILESALLN